MTNSGNYVLNILSTESFLPVLVLFESQMKFCWTSALQTQHHEQPCGAHTCL